MRVLIIDVFVFFFNDTATTEIYTLSLHDALPISLRMCRSDPQIVVTSTRTMASVRSEEHTSELQSHSDLVCRLLLEKKTKPTITLAHYTTTTIQKSIKKDTQLY